MCSRQNCQPHVTFDAPKPDTRTAFNNDGEKHDQCELLESPSPYQCWPLWPRQLMKKGLHYFAFGTCSVASGCSRSIHVGCLALRMVFIGPAFCSPSPVRRHVGGALPGPLHHGPNVLFVVANPGLFYHILSPRTLGRYLAIIRIQMKLTITEYSLTTSAKMDYKI